MLKNGCFFFLVFIVLLGQGNMLVEKKKKIIKT